MHNCLYRIVTDRNMCRYQYAIIHCFVWGTADKRHFCKKGDWSSLWVQAAVTQTSTAAGKVEGHYVHVLTGTLSYKLVQG